MYMMNSICFLLFVSWGGRPDAMGSKYKKWFLIKFEGELPDSLSCSAVEQTASESGGLSFVKGF